MLNLVRFWILLSSLLVGGGWVLSALHQLNRAGYLWLLSPLVVFMIYRWGRNRVFSNENLRRWRAKFTKRFRRRAPQIFLLMAVLAFLGGCLYPPLNYDANAYRLPRVMHWLWAGQWHWIHAFDARMNVAACGMEWLSAPLILFSQGDRLLFLINWVSYLMLPGLIFSVFARLQVSPRVAWWWAWLLSSGLCYVVQAGSIGNDSFAAIYILAAVDLALRARQSGSASDLWLSLLAAALVTGVKQTNIPLVGLWCIAAWPARSLLWKNPVRSALFAGVALLISVVPISVINYHQCGTWMPLQVTGVATLGQFKLNPFWGLLGNVFCIPVQNLVPPFYSLLPPFFSYGPVLWNEMMRHFLLTGVGAHFRSFENFGCLSEAYYRGVCERNAGIGLGIFIMVFATMRMLRKPAISGGGGDGGTAVPQLRLLRLVPWALLVLFMAKVGALENARHLAPYYAFLFPAWLARPGHLQVIRQRPWRRLAVVVMSVSALVLVASAERPLFPAETVFTLIRQGLPNSDLLANECIHYLEPNERVASARREYLKANLPPGDAPVGYFDELQGVDEPGIWLPYGRRRVECVLPDDPPGRLRDLGVHTVVVNGVTVRKTDGGIEKWMERYQASRVGEYRFPQSERPKAEPDFFIVQLN